MVGLGDLPGGAFSSIAYNVSTDGSVVVGRSASASGSEAFRWTSGGGMVGLGDLAGGAFDSSASAISSDGLIVVGRATTALGQEAFIWDSVNGMRRLYDVLESDFGLGASLTGWTLNSATAISADGTTIVGYGLNPFGNTEAWLFTIPEPSTSAMLAAGVALSAWVAKHRRRA
jgi:probable HAF family extracellular repeat protein